MGTLDAFPLCKLAEIYNVVKIEQSIKIYVSFCKNVQNAADLPFPEQKIYDSAILPKV